jgi:flagellar hook-associated protein 2
VVSGIHLASGFGTIKPTNKELAGDYALRTVTDRLSSMMYSSVSGSSRFSMLADLGISLKSGGTLNLDASKLTAAVHSDAAGVAALISQKMADLDRMVDAMIDSESGVFALRQAALERQSKDLGLRVEREEAWLERYGESLRKRFTAMDVAVGTQMSNIEQLLNMSKRS